MDAIKESFAIFKVLVMKWEDKNDRDRILFSCLFYLPDP